MLPAARLSAKHTSFCLHDVAASPHLDNLLIGLLALRTQSDRRAATAFSGTLVLSSDGGVRISGLAEPEVAGRGQDTPCLQMGPWA